MVQASSEKLNIPGITFARLIDEIRSQGIEGSKVTKVQELPNNWLKIRFLTKSGEKELVLLEKAFFILNYSLKAKQQSSGFGGFLNKHLRNQRLQAITQLGLERVFFFDFGSLVLVAEMFAKGNILLLDSSKKILGCLRAEKWSTRELRKGALYVQPPAKPDIALMQFSEFLEKIGQQKAIVPAIVKELGIPPVIAEEACSQIGLEKDLAAEQIETKKLESLFIALKSLQSKPREHDKAVLIEHRQSYYLLPFPLQSFASSTVAEFKSINDALNELLVVQSIAPKSESIEKKISELKHSLQKQQEMLEACKKASASIRAEAEKMYLHFSELSSAFDFAKKEFEKKSETKKVMYNRAFGNVILKYIDFQKGKAVMELKE